MAVSHGTTLHKQSSWFYLCLIAHIMPHQCPSMVLGGQNFPLPLPLECSTLYADCPIKSDHVFWGGKSEVLLEEDKFLMLLEQPSEYMHMEIRERLGLKISNQRMYFRIKTLDENTQGVSLEREGAASEYNGEQESMK